jgi:general secretion pathway protein L
MSVADGLIVFLPSAGAEETEWMRVVDGAVVQDGAGAGWLSACGIAALPADCIVMLVPPADLTPLHWIAHPDLPVRQGRAAARLAALSSGIAPADSLFAADDGNDDPARAHIVAVAARADMQHWLLWAQHHGLDADLIVPAALLLPDPPDGYVRGQVGGMTLLRGTDVALVEDMAAMLLPPDTPVSDVSPDMIRRAAIAALDDPPLDLRQGTFAKRVQRVVDERALTRIAIWTGCILLASLLIALVGILRDKAETDRLDAESLAIARQAVPDASDAIQADAALDGRLAARGAGGRAFTAPVAGLMTAMQGAPGVALTTLSRDADGMLRATLASARAQDINIVLVALQSAGFTITATSAQGPDGRTLADITVRS